MENTNPDRYTRDQWARYYNSALSRLAQCRADKVLNAYMQRGQSHVADVHIGFWRRRIAFLEANRPHRTRRSARA